MAEYYKYTKKHFEYGLRGILFKHKYPDFNDITEELLSLGKDIWEIVYRVPTRNGAVDILVFSSVDRRTASVRDLGGDSVKVVLRWRTKNGYLYKKIAHHYRLKTLFDNLEKSLVNAQTQVFNLKFGEFSPEING